MKPDEHALFIKWYEEEVKKETPYVLWDELVSYCEQDVKVLRLACVKFECLFMTALGFAPLASQITIAGVCMAVYRKVYYRALTIGLIPYKGYRWTNPQSNMALEWLAYRQSLLPEGQIIRHAGNSREVKVGNYRVDGFLEPNTILEAYGCLFHGCRSCYPTHRRPRKSYDGGRPVPDLDDRYERTVKRERFLRKQGYNVISIWGCEFDRLKKRIPEAFQNLERYPEPLKARDSFFGGRTSAFVTLYDTTGTEKILYKDFTSLYPYVNKLGLYPIGHPKTYILDDCPDPRSVVGLINCRILPPKKLLYPVLPSHGADGKLLFVLCRTCAEEANQDTCKHTDQQRELTGTWVSLEVIAALDRGYIITKMFEVWHYPNHTQYDPVTRTGGLFTEYVNAF